MSEITEIILFLVPLNASAGMTSEEKFTAVTVYLAKTDSGN